MALPIVYVVHIANRDMQKYAEVIDAHRDWVDKNVATSAFLLCGPFENRAAGGMVIARAESREALDRILAEDPCLVHGAAIHEVFTLQVSRGHFAHMLGTEKVS